MRFKEICIKTMTNKFRINYIEELSIKSDLNNFLYNIFSYNNTKIS